MTAPTATPRVEPTATKAAGNPTVAPPPIEVAAAQVESSPVRAEATSTAVPATATPTPPATATTTRPGAAGQPTAPSSPTAEPTVGSAGPTIAAGPVTLASVADGANVTAPGAPTRPAATCDQATLSVFQTVLNGDPATASALGCPLAPAQVVAIQTQTMRAGWLLDTGRPGPIYAVSGNWTWQPLSGGSIAGILAAGAPLQLGPAQGSPYATQGLIQTFDGGVALSGPEGYIFVLLSGGRARVY